MDNESINNIISQIDRSCQNDLCQLNSVISSLKDLTNMMRTDNFRYSLSPSHWQSIVKITRPVQKVLSKDAFEVEELDFLAEFFRFLRNSCAGSSAQNSRFILSCSEILNCVTHTMNCFKNKTSEKEITVLKCCVQLHGNLVCQTQDAKTFVWKHFLEQNLFLYLFGHKDNIVREYSMMVLYNSMTDDAARFLIGTNEGHQILGSLLKSLCEDLVDWGILFLEFILKYENFFHNCYNILPIQSRLLILDIIIEQLSSGPGNSYFTVPMSSINFIKELFIEDAMNIVQICNNEVSDLKPVEVVKLLGLLCDASVTDAYANVLRPSRDLLEASLDTLKSVHILGKTSSNVFSSIRNLKSMNEIDRNRVECNPSYGFKKNLIRLIGNLCCNCKDNQDTVRKLDGIPLLLDCCNLDARNPFIMQWCILAIRNIMERNPENQEILAGVTVTEDLVDSALIKELGFEIQNRNGKLILRPLPSRN